jgi:predicted nucleic acid-binding protein
MISAQVVCNSSPLIALDQIGQLDLLERLFGAVLVPSAVASETAPTVVLPSWIREQPLAQPLGPQMLGAMLGPGESEAIGLALETGATWVILDDRPARRLAQALGLPVVGTLGVLVAAKRRGFLPKVQPSVDALIQNGFRIAADLYKRVLADAGENP